MQDTDPVRAVCAMLFSAIHTVTVWFLQDFQRKPQCPLYTSSIHSKHFSMELNFFLGAYDFSSLAMTFAMILRSWHDILRLSQSNCTGHIQQGDDVIVLLAAKIAGFSNRAVADQGLCFASCGPCNHTVRSLCDYSTKLLPVAPSQISQPGCTLSCNDLQMTLRSPCNIGQSLGLPSIAGLQCSDSDIESRYLC